MQAENDIWEQSGKIKSPCWCRKKKRRVSNLLEGFAVTDDDVGPETLRGDVLLQPAAQVLDGRL